MRLANPHCACPNCKEVFDWRSEWYPISEQQLIFKERAAMDCPLCHIGVFGRWGDIKIAPKGIEILRRSKVLALRSEEPIESIWETYKWSL